MGRRTLRIEYAALPVLRRGHDAAPHLPDDQAFGSCPLFANCRSPHSGSTRIMPAPTPTLYDNEVALSQPESPSGVSPATPHGRFVDGAGNRGSQPGWRVRAVAYVALIGAVLVVVAIVLGIVWLLA
jgi:hypothetical protein